MYSCWTELFEIRLCKNEFDIKQPEKFIGQKIQPTNFNKYMKWECVSLEDAYLDFHFW